MNGGQLMVVLIVLIAVIGGIVRNRHRHGQDWRGRRADADNAEADRLRGEVTMLKDRIAVLERVITDNHSSNDLDRQIERLRDPH